MRGWCVQLKTVAFSAGARHLSNSSWHRKETSRRKYLVQGFCNSLGQLGQQLKVAHLPGRQFCSGFLPVHSIAHSFLTCFQQTYKSTGKMHVKFLFRASLFFSG